MYQDNVIAVQKLKIKNLLNDENDRFWTNYLKIYNKNFK